MTKKQLATAMLRDWFESLEKTAPRPVQTSVSWLLRFFRPAASALGLRISSWSDRKIEIAVTVAGDAEGVAMLAAFEAVHLLWVRQDQLGTLGEEILTAQVQFFKPFPPDLKTLRLRCEITDSYLESLFSLLRQNSTAEAQHLITLHDHFEKKLGEISVTLNLQRKELLGSAKLDVN